MKKLIRVLASASIVVVASALGGIASPALAATNSLPTGDSLYVIDAGGTGIYETNAAGEMTLLDLQVPSGYYPAGALNPTDNMAYLVEVDDVSTFECDLHQIDLLGGAPRAALHIEGDETPVECYGLNIDANGNALINGMESVNYTPAVWKLNLETGEITDRVDIEQGLYGFTVAPDGTWYGLTDLGTLQLIDSTTGAFTEVVGTTKNDVYDCKFDSLGTLWFIDNDDDSAPFPMYSWRSGDTDYTTQSDTSVGGDTAAGLYGPTFVGASTQTITEEVAASSAPSEVSLSNTGINVALIAGVAGVALAGIFAGAIFVIARRRSV